MYKIEQFKLNIKFFLNFLISLIPLTLILGNSANNVIVLLIGFLGIVKYGRKIFFLEKKIYQYLIFSFFIYLIIITILNNFPKMNEGLMYKNHIIKSFFFLRFLVFFLVINKLIENNELNLKPFIITSAFLSFIIGIDILIQINTGSNLIGNPVTLERPSGFFGSENIAGGYLQRFCLFFSILGFVSLKLDKNRKLIFFISSIFFYIIILYTNNRMPLFIYTLILLIFYFFLFENVIKKIIVTIILISSFFIIINQNDYLKTNYLRLYSNIKQMIVIGPTLFISNFPREYMNRTNSYLLVFNGAVQLIKEKPLTGYGIKSFRINCKWQKVNGITVTMCQTHPHNYFLEIILDTGIIGAFLFYLLIILTILKYYKFIKISSYKEIILTLPFSLILLAELFPIRSTGSFFTTGNAIVIFFFFSIMLNINRINFKNLLNK